LHEYLFLHSSEFDRRIVDSYYTNLLGRAADPIGEANAANFLLSTGRLDAISVNLFFGTAPLDAVAEAILASDEFFAGH
jgi:hypothetical protein